MRLHLLPWQPGLHSLSQAWSILVRSAMLLSAIPTVRYAAVYLGAGERRRGMLELFLRERSLKEPRIVKQFLADNASYPLLVLEIISCDYSIGVKRRRNVCVVCSWIFWITLSLSFFFNLDRPWASYNGGDAASMAPKVNTLPEEVTTVAGATSCSTDAYENGRCSAFTCTSDFQPDLPSIEVYCLFSVPS